MKLIKLCDQVDSLLHVRLVCACIKTVPDNYNDNETDNIFTRLMQLNKIHLEVLD